MKSLNDYLNEAKKITGSDRQTAIRLGCTAQNISHARRGEGLGDEYAVKIAQLLGVDERLVIYSAKCESKRENKEFWQEQWEKIAGAVACLMAAFGPLLDAIQGTAISIMLSNRERHIAS